MYRATRLTRTHQSKMTSAFPQGNVLVSA